MKSSRILRPDFIVAMLAVVIGVCTMFVYIYQARIMARQMEATTWPYMETNLSDRSDRVFVTVKNKGVGPAIIKNVFITVDKERYAESKKNIDSMIFKMTQRKDLLNGYTSVTDRVMSAGEEIVFIEVSDSSSAKLFRKSIGEHNIDIEICYCSVLGDCWLFKGGKTSRCDGCD